MTKEPDPPISPPPGWVFPYEILWPGYGNEKVTLANLVSNADEYRIFNSTIGVFDPEAPSVTIEQVTKFAKPLEIAAGLQATFANNIWLISCFFLAPLHASILGHDRKAVGALLNKIADTAGTLDELLGQLPPKIDVALFFLRPAQSEALEPGGPQFSNVNTEMHDLSLVARGMADDIVAGDGRPTEIVRDTAMELLLEELHLAGVYDLRISDGSKIRGPHLAGRSGEFLATLLRHLAPDVSEEEWVPKIKPIRTSVSRKRKAAEARQKT